ncbi:Imidazole glycerol phosphate synthase subunit HisH [Paenibacillus allorhizoplanae]|uniref:Imidazole glycerol phosphate synthase subunit HisH n=1 Tax=Paenibacillus allorhizoplanae TaxID=2905648 RepID=A0ABM9CK97_9BACL|nr:imidazole glycerol phosphate synthase subunit HisH [Paenibacillus allorhizoplanae]CAH1215766.1 Imidazole glycerol phosphate synthase subunit HisH [Paenibacillus allorhizoplanae]
MSNSQVTIIDYGVGNIYSVTNAFEACGAQVTLTDDPEIILNSERVVLPGVGAFQDGMKGLQDRGLVEPIVNYANSNRPFIGICLGMQMLMDTSEEFGLHQGLGIIKGRVVAIPGTDLNKQRHKIPHIGWNELQRLSTSWDRTILEAIAIESSAYFVHSYTVIPDNLENRLADSYYNGRQISAVIKSGSVYGCQFHPEKSGEIGLRILSNFLKLE